MANRESYEKMDCLIGESELSTVFRAKRCSDQTTVALKETDLVKLQNFGGNEQSVRQELKNMSKMIHPNLVKIFAQFEGPNDLQHASFFLVMEFFEDETLQHSIDNARKRDSLFDEDLVLRWTCQLVSAIKYIHGNNVVHRNIKPRNIFMINSKRDVKLGDFGLPVSRTDRQQVAAVSRQYQPPEYLSSNHQYCQKCDVFALGATLHQLLSLTLYPVLGHDREFPFRTRQFYSLELLDFVKCLVSQDQSCRPEMSEAANNELIYQNSPENGSSRGRSFSTAAVEVLPKVTTQWISSIVEREKCQLVFGYGGDLIALSRNGESVLWRSRIVTKIAGVWHAAIDEFRKRLYICFHNRFDFANTQSVDVHVVDITDWCESCAPTPSPIQTQLIFHRRDWQCYGLTVQPELDVILIADWYNSKIGIWKLEHFGVFERGQNLEPGFVISKVGALKKGTFRPTRCALLPTKNARAKFRSVSTRFADGSFSIPNESEEHFQSYFLAVSDWSNNSIQLLKIDFPPQNSFSSQIRVEFLKTLATRGTTVGCLRGPVDLKFDLSTEILLVCDQQNCRVQCLIPDGRWPNCQARACSESLGRYFSALSFEERVGDKLFIIAGLSNGNLVRCSISIN